MATKEKNTVSREMVETALDNGCHVALADGTTLKRDQFGRDSHNLKEIFPSDDIRVVAVVSRDPFGHLTRDGMEHAIRTGGSVSIGGEVISSLDHLPDEDRLEKIRTQEAEAAEAGIDREIARLEQRRAQIAKRGEAAASVPKFPAASRPRSEPESATAKDFDKMTVEELKAEAQAREIDGRSTMNKDELTAALKKDAKKK